MTQDEAIAQIKKVSGGTLTEDDIRGLFDSTPGQLTRIIQNFVDQNEALKSRTVWSEIVRIMGLVQEWAPAAKQIGQIALAIIATV